MEPVRLLRERGIEPCIYYVNPNIHPDAEYARRLETIRAWTQQEGVAFSEGPRDVAAWEATAGRAGEAARARFGVICGGASGEQAGGTPQAKGGLQAGGAPQATAPHSIQAEAARQARCRACYRLRFEASARHAAEAGFDALGTTLSVSPYQYTDLIRDELERACAKAGVRAFFEDYRPFYDEATRRSREAGMYRQNFCGCRFSDEEAAAERLARKRMREEARAAKAAEHAQERAEQEALRASKRAERQAYAAKQARKREVRNALRERER